MNGILLFLRPTVKPRKIDVLEDNEGAIALAENPLSSSRSKLIDVRHHFLGNLTKEGVIETTHVPSEKQHADSSRRRCRKIFLKFTTALHSVSKSRRSAPKSESFVLVFVFLFS